MGLGTWQIKGDDTYRAVRYALEVGYRHIDTARLYGNEEQVGRALADSGIDRDEVFLTTKYAQHHPGGEEQALTESLRHLGVERIDLWLLHFPLKDPADNLAVWQRFLAAVDAGNVTAAGVSNHSLDQLDALTAATGRAPAVNQIRFNPALYDADLLAAHRRRGVILQAHSPLRRPPLSHPSLTALADRHGATPAQVVLAWHLAHDVAVIPKSVHRERISENYAAAQLTLSAADIVEIDALAGR
ncbi:aldo/keto reductase [Nocardia sp. NPDC050175]|uniref:aldo/keto reductase n=1 Tax=Nocardia sp. NPDC050175 TaxID=3364317 RepID=UPI00379E8412